MTSATTTRQQASVATRCDQCDELAPARDADWLPSWTKVYDAGVKVRQHAVAGADASVSRAPQPTSRGRKHWLSSTP
jgi:hypothetical protein